MYKVAVGEKIIMAEHGELLSGLLIREGFFVLHPCGGKGNCGKCRVLVDGREELSCEYRIEGDIVVELPKKEEIASEQCAAQSVYGTVTAEEQCLVLDIGTTTLALALVFAAGGKVQRVITGTNPQRQFGADVISRIEYCNRNSVGELQAVLLNEIKRMTGELGVIKVPCMYVTGNVTMLHIFLGECCETLGVAPYKPVFLERRELTGESLGICAVEKIITLPSIAAFTGADAVAGMNYIGLPGAGKYNLLIDLGTNAEVVLYSEKEAVCTSAAAGPCFEGANISCGMSATDGAVFSFSFDKDGKPEVGTIGESEPRGICGTGLIDVIAALLKAGIIDETGYMESGQYRLTEKVFISQEDIRQFQLAKSAVYAAVRSIMGQQGISYDDIAGLYISGGFSAKLNIESAIAVGLLPAELKEKCVAIGNSALLGAIRYACGADDLSAYIDNARYADLSVSTEFADLFIQNMMFEK